MEERVEGLFLRNNKRVAGRGGEGGNKGLTE